MRAKRLVILGAVGNCLDILEAALAMRAAGKSELEPIGFLDDAPERKGATVRGLPVLGGLDEAGGLDGCLFVNGIGSPASYAGKPELIARTGLADDRFARIIHPAAAVAPSVRLGIGSVLLANVTLCADVVVGRHVMMLPGCVAGHDTRIGDFGTLAGGVVLSGRVVVGRGVYLGAGSVVREGVGIGAGALLGMGAVLLRDMPERAVWYGNPAHPAERRK